MNKKEAKIKALGHVTLVIDTAIDDIYDYFCTMPSKDREKVKEAMGEINGTLWRRLLRLSSNKTKGEKPTEEEFGQRC